MSDSLGSGSGAGDSDGEREPKRQKVREATPEPSSSTAPGPSTSTARQSAATRRAASPQPGPSGEQQEPDSQNPEPEELAKALQNGKSAKGKSKKRKKTPKVVPPKLGSKRARRLRKLMRQRKREMERKHRDRLVRFWDGVISYYRNLPPQPQPGPQANLPLLGAQDQPGKEFSCINSFVNWKQLSLLCVMLSSTLLVIITKYDFMLVVTAQLYVAYSIGATAEDESAVKIYIYFHSGNDNIFFLPCDCFISLALEAKYDFPILDAAQIAAEQVVANAAAEAEQAPQVPDVQIVEPDAGEQGEPQAAGGDAGDAGQAAAQPQM
ncbi:uncharacterized protein LOC126299223 isoform X2 [Schistocerca gregaria]|uniref:uncharacterized protein LOC126299223 isoform X2 n=1 Tax=Schistocerca gregaria TaxID=7010 RepID=UPI00211EBD4A|nr:uncharacterized protein LOC126299223 isoform X2 [Schistocerca gregaria]